MKLYPLLSNRIAVNILKSLYDHEVLKKNSYTLKLSEAKKNMGIGNKVGKAEESCLMLSKYELIALDSVDNDYIMSITNKGKEFIETFDQLVELLLPKQVGGQSVRIKYELTNQEKRILIISYKISKESGSDEIPMQMIVQELYPVNQVGKASVVSRYVSKLEELGLMQRIRQGRNTLVFVTENGFKTIREQYLKGLMH